jgi:hypothetical protein
MLCAIVAVEFAMSPRMVPRLRESPPEVNSPAIYFAPQQDLSVVDQQIIRNARRSLEIAMYSFMDTRIAEELVDACHRGVLVELYRDLGQYEEETERGAVANLRIFADMPEQDDLVHTFCHLCFSFPSSASFSARRFFDPGPYWNTCVSASSAEICVYAPSADHAVDTEREW